MRNMTYANAIEDALAQAMTEDSRIIILGEDVRGLRANLLVRFGPHQGQHDPGQGDPTEDGGRRLTPHDQEGGTEGEWLNG